ncbi:MAG: hypothetical protein HXX13_07150 [Bacteroidetes bacterium]|nr:hypothetical protein [Bacteroidota bacterium]
MHLGTCLRKHYLFILLVGAILILASSCVTTTYNNRNWRRLPPSTGHSKCGCLIQKHTISFSEQNGETIRA